jgi:hypothetical protein
VKKSIKVVGFDLALNHMAAVELTDGVMTNHWFVTDIAASAARGKGVGLRLKRPKTKEKQIMQIHRLAQLENFIDKTVLMPSSPDYVGIEDYAIRAEQGAHYMGEVGGIARILCWFRGIPFRLHDPQSVKMFIAHDGTCQKDSVERAIAERFGVDFGVYNPPRAKPSKRVANPKQNRTTSEDLSDAYSVAWMVWTEVRLRAGEIMLKDLHPKEIQVFNRVTKTYPVSLLDREWIHNPDGTPTPHGSPCVKNAVRERAAVRKRRN